MATEPYAVDLVVPYLQRVHQATFEDMQEGLGVGRGDLTEAIGWLEARGVLDEGEEGYSLTGVTVVPPPLEEDARVDEERPPELDGRLHPDEEDVLAVAEWLVAWERGSTWVTAKSADEAAEVFSSSNDAARLDIGADVAIVHQKDVHRFGTRAILGRYPF